MADTKVENKKESPKTNYTPYRKNYSKAKSILVKKHQNEFKEILKGLNGNNK